MHIAIWAGGMPFSGDTIPSGKSLGGSESAAYYMARELAKLGNKVLLFTANPKPGKWDNVNYEWHGQVSEEAPLGDRWQYVMQAPFDVAIIQRHNFGFINRHNAKLNVWWLHDLALWRNYGPTQESLIFIDKIFTVSKFHARQVDQIYGAADSLGDVIYPTQNGIDYDDYARWCKPTGNRKPKTLLYAARPERGLENLIGMNDPIMAKLKDFHLCVCGYDNTVPQMRGYYEFLWKRCEELPNVTNVGHLGKAQLARLMAECELYVYPTTFEDTSCMMLLEANACGLPFLASNTAALPETAKDAGAVLLNLKDGEVNKGLFVQTVKDICNNRERWDYLHQKALEKKQSWADIAADWQRAFDIELAKKSSDKLRLHRHLERMSDIQAARYDGADDTTIPDMSKNYAFLLNDDFGGYYKRYYQYEHDRGVNYGPESLDGILRFEQMLEEIRRLKPDSILDYGCAHGLVAMNLWRRLGGKSPDNPLKVIHGVDISETNIEAARKWKSQEDAPVEFFLGETSSIPATYDCIVAGELLEHVPDPRGLCDDLIERLNPGGSMVITVPYGPWEAIGYREHPGWRAHVHHLERADLNDMLGHMPGYRLLGVPSRDNFGHYLVVFQKSDKKTMVVDYDRKLRQQAPQETVSVCIIARDAEDTLARTIKTVLPIADELIIGIDEKTKDKTIEVAERFGAKILHIQSPIESGFDEARNRTIEQAAMDWILWIDCDETWENIEHLRKYLRPNAYWGYGIPQHHYTVEPPSLFKTDFPCRVFRNNRGIKFYGVVHEHPERAFNQGPGKITILKDVHIMHTGYSTEAIRMKRFGRNFPLMRRDREKYPDRILGKFLWIRDLAIYNRAELQRTGGTISAQMMANADAGIKNWRELLNYSVDMAGRWVIEAIPFVTELVKLKTQNSGINILSGLEAMRGNGRQLDFQTKIEGQLENIEDIEKLSSWLVKVKTRYLEDKYY